MPNLDRWINQNSNDEKYTATTTMKNKFENHLRSIRAEWQKMIRPNSYPAYNKRLKKL